MGKEPGVSRTIRRKNVRGLGEDSPWLKAIFAVYGFKNTDTEKDRLRRKRLAYTDRKGGEYGPAPKHFRVSFVRRDRHQETQALRSVVAAGHLEDFLPRRLQHRHSATYAWY